ncbi:MAG TPA: RDD family protein [Patescibacteria group bacterium]|nr:RDD family protein [Patescibacteria group bacterium]
MNQYAGFWKRVWARVIDALVLLPFGLLNYWAWSDSRRLTILAALPMGALMPAYLIITHGFLGQSLGKRALHLRVESQSGGRLSWGGVVARFSPLALYEVTWALGVMSSVHGLSDVQFQAASLLQKYHLILTGTPGWVHLCNTFFSCWVLADVIVLVSRPDKRALHDFLGGSVVRRVDVGPVAEAEQMPWK